MDDHNGSTKDCQVRKLDTFVRKLSDEEIKMFLVVLGALMAQVPAPRDARKSYLKEVEVRLRNNGADFLAKSRSFPTYGLKLLGRDRDGFPIAGFKRQSGKDYPALLSWYWSELERLSEVSKPSKCDVLRAQRVLCVLSFSKMIKTSSVNQIKKSLTDFEERVKPVPPKKKKKSGNNDDCASSEEKSDPSQLTTGEGETDTPEEFFSKDCPPLMETLNVDVQLDKLPQYLDLGSLSTKPSSLREQPAFPNWFETQFWGGIRRAVERQQGKDPDGPLFGFKDPPYGRVHVLTESAGKLRLIVPYNTPFVHSTGLFSRCRALLRSIRGDYCTDQAGGHRFVQAGTCLRDNKMNISADLSNFTDDTSPEALSFGLRSLDLGDLESFLFKLPICLPNGKLIVPSKLLMGLKGCFEFSTLLHHYFVRRGGILRYAMCGDDFFFRGDLSTYLESLKHSGWSLNRSKTVVSATAAVFCGEMYWFGYRVSPRVPKVSSCFQSNGKPVKASVLFSVVRDTIVSLNQIYSRRSVARVIGPFIRLLRRRWKGCVFPELPAKLRGLGMKSSRQGSGLLKALNKPAVERCCKLSIGSIKDDTPRHRWFGIPIELTPCEIQREFPDFPALLKRGAVRLDVPPDPKRVPKDISALDVTDVLEWYYNDTRYDFNQVLPR
jgi:hypothetical protein